MNYHHAVVYQYAGKWMEMRNAPRPGRNGKVKLSKSSEDKQLSALLIYIGVCVVASAIALVWIYAAKFGAALPTKRDELGQLGDYVGGLLNPIVGMATVVLVIISITIQRKELQASLRELKSANQATARMSFEQSLFAWLSNYQDLVKSVHANGAIGRNALTALCRSYLAFPSVHAHKPGCELTQDDKQRAQHFSNSIKWEVNDWLEVLDIRVRDARENYQKMYEEHQTELDALPRTMFRLLRWIDTSSITPAEKWHYAALVRAQLSWTELVLFFYNCYSTDGKDFASVANRFALFDNLKPGRDILIEHVRRQPDRKIVAPLEPRAFDSKLAKIAMGIHE